MNLKIPTLNDTALPLDRRAFLQQAAVVALSVAAPSWSGVLKGSKMGIVVHSYAFRWNPKIENNAFPGFKNALDLLEHSHQVGAGGIQTMTRDWTADFVKKLRVRREQLGMYLEGSISVPNTLDDVNRFEKELVQAKEAGVSILRTVCSSGRRYEAYPSADSFRTAKHQALIHLQLAEPILRKYKMKLAVENHKDWLAAEHVALIKELQSEWIGVTLDFGNSIALMEDPMEVVRTLAPYAFTTHVKDMGLDEYKDGFLLSEVPMGKGMLNLPEMVALCKKFNPEIKFNLEMITRDPLEIPCLKESYWATFEHATAQDLARSLRMVRQYKFRPELPRVSQLSLDEKFKVEEKNIIDCLDYSNSSLGLN